MKLGTLIDSADRQRHHRGPSAPEAGSSARTFMVLERV